MRMTFAVLLTAVLASAPHGEAAACMHALRAATGVTVQQSEQTALIVYNDGQQELVIRPALAAEGALTGLAWVIPVPSVPSKYAVADTRLFDAVDQLAGLVEVVNPPQKKGGMRTRGSAPAAAAGVSPLVVLPTAKAGPFEIHPLQAVGAEGAKQLNAWMTENGFAELAQDELAYYSGRGWTFLAVKVAAVKRGSLSAGRLPPLHLSFASERIVYPLKLSANQGRFDLRLFIVGRAQPEGLSESVEKFKFTRIAHEPRLAAGEGVPARRYPNGTVLKATEAFDADSVESPLKKLLGAAKLSGKLHLEVLQATINGWETMVESWPDDFAIPPLAESAVVERDVAEVQAPSDDTTTATPPSPVVPAPTAAPKPNGCAAVGSPLAPPSATWLWIGLAWLFVRRDARG